MAQAIALTIGLYGAVVGAAFGELAGAGGLSVVGSLDDNVLWRVDGGVVQRAPDGDTQKFNIQDPCASRIGCNLLSSELGRDRDGRATFVSIRCHESTRCELIDDPLDGKSLRRVVPGLLPKGAISAAQWRDHIVMSTTGRGQASLASSHPGVFTWQDGRWRRLPGFREVDGLSVRGSEVLARTIEDDEFYATSLVLFDLRRSAARRRLAYEPYRNLADQCRAEYLCSVFQNDPQLSRQYVYLNEFTARYNLDPMDPAHRSNYQTVICRFDLQHPQHVSRWLPPDLLGSFAVAAGSLFATAPSDPGANQGEPIPGVYQYAPTWEPASSAAPLEANGPCSTNPPFG